jgi:hypothetical protein
MPTNTALPFVYTIFSLFAPSFVYAPLAVVGLGGYRATLEKDIIVCVDEVAIDISYTKD